MNDTLVSCAPVVCTLQTFLDVYIVAHTNGKYCYFMSHEFTSFVCVSLGMFPGICAFYASVNCYCLHISYSIY